MAPSCPDELLEEAVDLVREAGELTLRWFRSDDLAVDRKDDGTPVTEADRAAEQLLRQRLEQRHPGDAILGEEEGGSDGTTGRRWVIDPIDGTKAFTRGVPLYTNLLAADDEHGPLLGVVNMPALGETVYAGRGIGCFCDGRPARVSSRDDLTTAYVTTSGFGGWSEQALVALRQAGVHLRTWGDGYGYALVATGRVEAMVDSRASEWDLAPMPVILSEAGGTFTSMAGRPAIDGGSGLASNGILHDQLVELLAAA